MARELVEFKDYISVDAVAVDREHRQRQGEMDLEQLTESIRQRGLYNPIVIDERNVLVAGERRLEAFKALGYMEIPYKRSTELSPLEHALLEYEENAKRRDLSWQDNALALYKLCELFRKEDPEVTEAQLSVRIGVHVSLIARIRRVVTAWDQEKIRSANTLAEAANILAKQNQRASVEALNELISVDRELAGEKLESPFVDTLKQDFENQFPDDNTNSGNEFEIRVTPLPDGSPLKITSPDFRTAVVVDRKRIEKVHAVRPAEKDLLCKNFHEWLSGRKANATKFNLIHCDFPYGKNVHGENLESRSKTFGKQMSDRKYDDSPQVYWDLLEAFTKNFDLFASISCHVVFWYTREYEAETVKALESCGLTLYRFPLVWLKSDNKGVCSDPKRTPRHVYETALLGWRGDRNIVKIVADAYAGPTDRALHPSAKPEPMLRHFFTMLVDQHSTLFDPTCGGGSALRAAESLGAKSVLGLEQDKNFTESAQKELTKFRTLRALS